MWSYCFLCSRWVHIIWWPSVSLSISPFNNGRFSELQNSWRHRICGNSSVNSPQWILTICIASRHKEVLFTRNYDDKSCSFFSLLLLLFFKSRTFYRFMTCTFLKSIDSFSVFYSENFQSVGFSMVLSLARRNFSLFRFENLLVMHFKKTISIRD